MKSTDGGKKLANKGIFIEDLDPRMILKPTPLQHLAGGVGDPSAVASGEYLYLFTANTVIPGVYSKTSYDPRTERSGQVHQCVARIALKDLDHPAGKARRWDGKGFNAAYNGIGCKPIGSLQIPMEAGGGPSSSPQEISLGLR